jgi:hypothetical protein
MPTLSIFSQKGMNPSCLLHPIIAIDPFSKWGIYFMQCKPTSSRGHGYIIIVIDYFTKWAEAMPTFINDGHIVALFIFNHIIARFGVPQAIVTDHGLTFSKPDDE